MNNFPLSPIAASTDFRIHSTISKVSPNFSVRHFSSSSHLYALISFSFSKTRSDKIRLWLMQLSFLRCIHAQISTGPRSGSEGDRFRTSALLAFDSLRKSSYTYVDIKQLFSLFFLFLFLSPFFSLFFSFYIAI